MPIEEDRWPDSTVKEPSSIAAPSLLPMLLPLSPPQKAATDAALKIESVAGAGGEGRLNGSYEMSQAVTELGKRTAETMFLREILYRRCEARMSARVPLISADAKQAGAQDPVKAAAEVKGRVEADDAFFDKVMETYSGLVSTKERAERVALMRELQQKLAADALKDAELLKRVAAAVDDPSKVAAVYERAAELAKKAEDEKKKKEEEEAKKKCLDGCDSHGKCVEACKKADPKKDPKACDDECTAKSSCAAACTKK